MNTLLAHSCSGGGEAPCLMNWMSWPSNRYIHPLSIILHLYQRVSSTTPPPICFAHSNYWVHRGHTRAAWRGHPRHLGDWSLCTRRIQQWLRASGRYDFFCYFITSLCHQNITFFLLFSSPPKTLMQIARVLNSRMWNWRWHGWRLRWISPRLLTWLDQLLWTRYDKIKNIDRKRKRKRMERGNMDAKC